MTPQFILAAAAGGTLGSLVLLDLTGGVIGFKSIISRRCWT
jgi:hypothetical protein